MRARGFWLLPLAVAGMIFWLSAQSHYPGGLQLPPPLDKVGHAAIFGVLALALDLALRRSAPGLPLYRRHLLILALVAL
ncbi:MAG: hypothetical protein NDI58_02035, partial [Geothrix sp.]|nr:hypothetical protein [Geothrix sp.]